MCGAYCKRVITSYSIHYTKLYDGYIGKSLYSTDGYLNAKIDNFRIYSDALTPSEIAEESLLVQYDFSETSGSSVADSSGNGFTGTLSGGAAFSSGTLSLNGSNGYVTIPNGVMKGVHNVTILADIYLTSSSTNAWVYGLGPNSGTYIFLNSKNGAGKTYGAITTRNNFV